MLYQILAYLLEVIATLLGGACLLRLYMQRQRVPFGNPVGRFVFALSDWLVLPLRKLLPAIARWDTASLVGAWLVMLLQVLILWGLRGGHAPVGLLFLAALVAVLRLAISVATGLVIIYAVLSWVSNDSPLSDVLDRLCAPLLQPFRKLLPLVGGIDLSPLALLVTLQVAGMVLDGLTRF